MEIWKRELQTKLNMFGTEWPLEEFISRILQQKRKETITELKQLTRNYKKQYPDADFNDFIGLLAGSQIEIKSNNQPYIKLLKKWKEIIAKLAQYAQHERNCIIDQLEAGRPTKKGGYEQLFRGKWYQSSPINKTPKCECGLVDILNKLK